MINLAKKLLINQIDNCRLYIMRTLNYHFKTLNKIVII